MVDGEAYYKAGNSVATELSFKIPYFCKIIKKLTIGK